ncbi:hypothetical protein QTG54_006327 [Skeletonema marinoi]|uniref:Uncharacterized protein n=1 Tax=Skeletonema marinoi TaxID=267567 RepID=A0AAD8YCU9_9STRA|nr:hypothetical protein QTG54_006327 [Skeletonema marinoi]|mmetsp:Transcript_19174/g.38586  ORF Transcript_19174/g.38586 Transcript_19174/m.38586 type:complete len:88 (-) Transcript_19174:294-557(-)|eukprot:CAMPEP_0113388226 /NCGR_PEP_ID=MMETSP0013_2-20120614/8968_1 /TAXON_ID=2843 ORGANISM="Skeletonema costatum, Strain 1716" /NCGR_SAMPLE_ID=MMETSP0013_2 /ASSEMBLY_ACC=CAM_ASM_000158 /LENGTH=87 /DNA_ID=CAMNT_0000271197 /DNA_START=103 /DNA_END=366 /DNA_ORIENTATION=- /assembly_acc=CAM_ASM_000158
MAEKKKSYHQGHDIKSLVINLATALLFFLPFALYYDIKEQQSENVTLYCGVVVGGLLLSLIVPPVGWMRPHPYTDMPGNVPLKFRRD